MSRRYEWEREVAVEAVREAARLCRAVGAEISPEVLAKKDKSPVTVADFGSQALIARAGRGVPGRSHHRRGRLGRAASARECGDPGPGAPARPRRPGRGERHPRRRRGLPMDRPRRHERVSRPVLDARPDRRHQGIPPRRAVCRRAGAGPAMARSSWRRWRVPAWTPCSTPCRAKGRLSYRWKRRRRANTVPPVHDPRQRPRRSGGRAVLRVGRVGA